MSLRDLEEAVRGLWDGGVAASGTAVASSTADQHASSGRSDIVVHAVSTDRQSATALRRWCGLDVSEHALPIPTFSEVIDSPPLVRHTTKLDTMVVVLSREWMPPTWLCVVTLQDMLTSCRGTCSDQTTHTGWTVDMPAQDWRRFFRSLLHHVNACALRFESVDDQAGTAVLHFPDLRCRASVQRVRSMEDAQKVVLWSSARLARALALQTETVAVLEKNVSSATHQLERATAELTTLARECGKASPLNGQGALAGEPGYSSKAAAASSAPVSLVNPQARPGMKRGRGMRIQ